MTEEFFDVVNELDEVIGVRSRPDVHRLGLLHRAVHVLVFNNAGQVFLQKRSMAKDSHPGKWDSSASGHVDSGETYLVCAKREIREELGVDTPPKLQPLFKIPAGPQTDSEHVQVYRATHEGPFCLQASEIETGEWFDAARVDSWLTGRPDEFATAFRTIWTRLRS